MILEDIKEALDGINGPVFYGTASSKPKQAPWNYTVYSRVTTDTNTHLTSRADVFEVALVHEGYLPEEAVKNAILAMSALPGMSLAQGVSTKYVYDVKPGTKTTVEMAVITFNKASCSARGARR